MTSARTDLNWTKGMGGSRAGNSSHPGYPSRVTLLRALQKTFSLLHPYPSGDVPSPNT